jgi:hypothetical protein
MRFLFLTAILALPVAAEETLCDMIRIRAEGLLEARFDPNFNLEAAKVATQGNELFEAMLRDAWVTKPGPIDKRPQQVQDFADDWYAICVFGS